MDMEQRDSLRSVCRLWHVEMEFRGVLRLARHTIRASETAVPEKRYPPELVTTMLRGFTPRLETYVFSCDPTPVDEEDAPYRNDYYRLTPYLLLAVNKMPCDALKKIVFCGGYLCQEMLSYFICKPVQIVLRKIFVRNPGVRFEHFIRKTNFCVYVEAGQIGGTPMTLTKNHIRRKVYTFDLVSEFLADVLDKTPVNPQDREQIKGAIAGKTVPGRALAYLTWNTC